MRKEKHNDEGFITIDCHIIIGRQQGKGETQTHPVTLCMCVCVFVCLASCRFSRSYQFQLSPDNPSLPPSLRLPPSLSPSVSPNLLLCPSSTDPPTLSSSLAPPFDPLCLPPFLASTFEEEIRAPALAHLKSYILIYIIYI